MNEFILHNLNIFLSVAGSLMIFVSLAPVISKNYFDNVNKNSRRDKDKFVSKRFKYIYNRYIRGIDFLFFGILLIGYAFYLTFF